MTYPNFPTPRAPDPVFEGWRQERLRREAEQRQRQHDLELQREQRGAVVRTVAFSALCASPRLRRALAWVGAVIVVLGLALALADAGVGAIGVVIGAWLMAVALLAAGVGKVGQIVVEDVRDTFGGHMTMPR
jgi:lipopolysaccharide export LptBFGC system permease protein LptF